MNVELPPTWRIRKVGSHWTVLRLQPIRHTYYIPVKNLPTWEAARKWLAMRTGVIPMDESFDGERDDFPRD